MALEFRPKGTWAWQGLRANTSGEVFLTELREATWYELRMRACNSAGCGNETAQFATLDYDGSEWGRGGNSTDAGGGSQGSCQREKLTKRKISRTMVRRKADRWVPAKAAAHWQAGGKQRVHEGQVDTQVRTLGPPKAGALLAIASEAGGLGGSGEGPALRPATDSV